MSTGARGDRELGSKGLHVKLPQGPGCTVPWRKGQTQPWVWEGAWGRGGRGMRKTLRSERSPRPQSLPTPFPPAVHSGLEPTLLPWVLPLLGNLHPHPRTRCLGPFLHHLATVCPSSLRLSFSASGGNVPMRVPCLLHRNPVITENKSPLQKFPPKARGRGAGLLLPTPLQGRPPPPDASLTVPLSFPPPTPYRFPVLAWGPAWGGRAVLEGLLSFSLATN